MYNCSRDKKWKYTPKIKKDHFCVQILKHTGAMTLWHVGGMLKQPIIAWLGATSLVSKFDVLTQWCMACEGGKEINIRAVDVTFRSRWRGVETSKVSLRSGYWPAEHCRSSPAFIRLLAIFFFVILLFPNHPLNGGPLSLVMDPLHGVHGTENLFETSTKKMTAKTKIITGFKVFENTHSLLFWAFRIRKLCFSTVQKGPKRS